jgi:hypothetical protein
MLLDAPATDVEAADATSPAGGSSGMIRGLVRARDQG